MYQIKLAQRITRVLFAVLQLILISWLPACWASTAGASVCSLCQAGTYWTGSGQFQLITKAVCCCEQKLGGRYRTERKKIPEGHVKASENSHIVCVCVCVCVCV